MTTAPPEVMSAGYGMRVRGASGAVGVLVVVQSRVRLILQSNHWPNH
jgi:hypothetical protein